MIVRQVQPHVILSRACCSESIAPRVRRPSIWSARCAITVSRIGTRSSGAEEDRNVQCLLGFGCKCLTSCAAKGDRRRKVITSRWHLLHLLKVLANNLLAIMESGTMHPNSQEFQHKRLKPEGVLRRKRWGLAGQTPRHPTLHPAEHLTADLDTQVSVTPHPEDTLVVPRPREYAKYITADDAYAHATAKEDAIKEALAGLQYEGGYSLHAGFNEDMLHCGQRQEEIYVVLDERVSNEVAVALGDIFAPYPGVVYTPEGAYNIRADNPKLQSVLHGENMEERKAAREAVAKPDTIPEQEREPEGAKRTSEGGEDVQAIRIPFRSTVFLKSSETSNEKATELSATSCLELLINKNPKSNSPPPGSKWSGAWMSVELTTLDISARRSCSELRSNYTLALCQICLMSTLTPASVLRSTPFMMHVEDTVKPQAQPSVARTIWRTLAGCITLCFGLTKNPAVTVGAERTRHCWDIYSQLVGAGSEDHGEGTAWTYLHNGSAGTELKGVAAERVELEPKPKLLMGYTVSKDHEVEVEVVVHWSLNAARSRQTLQPAFAFVPATKTEGKGRARIPAFMNFLHHTSVVVDLGNVRLDGQPREGAGEVEGGNRPG
ncbi:hypothetical protein LshimejAT787_1301290 [Lyophyllum shimeji]|uniref:Uncharacterized protein n=1 Tax=Lyophyllum shimeji TaxID=47721 RepID=A0A9P3PWE9_LYOSH|nr:hypothetical protein LshimejAT787_1301290 [Lyophyllum shimeji]